MTVKSKQSLRHGFTQWKFSFLTRLWHQRKSRLLVKRSRTAPSVNYHELALQLATAADIHQDLPMVLRQLQQQLENQYSTTGDFNLCVVMSNDQSNETFVHHSYQSNPSPQFIKLLHRSFTVNKQPQDGRVTPLPGETESGFLTHKLLDQDGFRVWLLTVFEYDQGRCEPVNQHIVKIVPILSRGIAAWHQQECKIKQAVSKDRALYAAELHDSLAQVLGYLRIKSARLDKQCSNNEFALLKSTTEDLAAYTHCAYRQCRELIASARLDNLSEDLSDGILSAIEEFEQQSAIVFELDNRLPNQCLSRQQIMQVLYIIREGLSNTIRHSHATHSRIVLTQLGNGEPQITVEDNGVGLAGHKPRRDSYGLQIMHERAKRIHGVLDVGDRPGGGTRLVLTLRMEKNSE